MMDTVRLLLVEDDDVDAEGVERALRKAGVDNPVERAIGGIEALARLRGKDGKPPLPRPYLILLDLNMPRMDGIAFLDELRADPALSDSVVFVLTTSDADRDKVRAYQAHVAGYMLKSRVGARFVNLVDLLNPYWQYIELPDWRLIHGAGDEDETCAKSLHLLVVDDDELDAELVRRAAPADSRITEARSAAQCKSLLPALRPDCVLLDHRLSDEDGLSLLPLIRERNMPVVMMTGMWDEKVAGTARKLGVNGFVTKDVISRETLQPIIRNAIIDAAGSSHRPTGHCYKGR